MPVLVLARTFNVARYYLHTETWEALRISGTCSGIAKESEGAGYGGMGKEWNVLGTFKLQLQLIVIICYSVRAGYGSRVNDSAQDLGAQNQNRRLAKAVDRQTENRE